jgi:hypothetical protein
MANLEHLAKLKKNVEAWNSWRRKQPAVEIDLLEAHLNGANLIGADLAEANLIEANLNGAHLNGANLVGANLNQADLTEANLTKAKLNGANLIGADLIRANLIEVNLNRANLNRANLNRADLTGADLTGANLTETNLTRANFTGANLNRANVENANVAYTTFGDNDLSKVDGLESVKYGGPCTIGIDAIYRSQGNIPEQFLRGVGVPDDFITYMRSLTGKTFEFYSCFISYSTKDDAFVTELHTKLQAQKVRCWKDSEDLKIGDKFQETIDSAIRLHDKLLLVLSEQSMQSSWVEWEVKKALKKEQESGSTVLFPVRLDDAVMESPYAWAGEVRKRHIGDFRKWKDHDSFQKSLDRLLRDLKSQDSKPKG